MQDLKRYFKRFVYVKPETNTTWQHKMKKNRTNAVSSGNELDFIKKLFKQHMKQSLLLSVQTDLKRWNDLVLAQHCDILHSWIQLLCWESLPEGGMYSSSVTVHASRAATELVPTAALVIASPTVNCSSICLAWKTQQTLTDTTN